MENRSIWDIIYKFGISYINLGYQFEYQFEKTDIEVEEISVLYQFVQV